MAQSCAKPVFIRTEPGKPSRYYHSFRSSNVAHPSGTLVIAMHRTTDESAQAAAVDFANRIVPLWQAVLGSELLGAYLMAILTHCGFSARSSAIYPPPPTQPRPAPPTPPPLPTPPPTHP